MGEGGGRTGMGVGCEERDENSEEEGKVGGYKNPRAAYCLRRRRVMVRLRGGDGWRMGIRRE